MIAAARSSSIWRATYTKPFVESARSLSSAASATGVSLRIDASVEAVALASVMCRGSA